MLNIVVTDRGSPRTFTVIKYKISINLQKSAKLILLKGILSIFSISRFVNYVKVRRHTRA